MAEAIKVKRSGMRLGNTFAGGKGTTSRSGCPTARADRVPGHADSPVIRPNSAVARGAGQPPSIFGVRV